MRRRPNRRHARWSCRGLGNDQRTHGNAPTGARPWQQAAGARPCPFGRRCAQRPHHRTTHPCRDRERRRSFKRLQFPAGTAETRSPRPPDARSYRRTCRLERRWFLVGSPYGRTGCRRRTRPTAPRPPRHSHHGTRRRHRPTRSPSPRPRQSVANSICCFGSLPRP